MNTFLKLDNALFEATLPVVELVSTSSTQTQITSKGTFADIGGTTKSAVLLKGPAILLDKGLITVSDGPLFSLKNDSTMNVLGDFIQLGGGSKINVVNGPAILVQGNPTTVNITGALLKFLETSGNTFIINNPTASNATRGGSLNNEIPVFIEPNTSSSITIGPKPIINKGSQVSITGAAIEARGGGTVVITAPNGGG